MNPISIDTGSPVTIVSLEFLLQVLAKKRPPEQPPEEWKKQVEKRLEPTSVALRNYGGGCLPVVRQVFVMITRSGHQVEVVVQVQKEAPAKLLIETYLLLKLGFLFLCTEMGDDDVDLLEDQRCPREREEAQTTLMPAEVENAMEQSFTENIPTSVEM